MIPKDFLGMCNVSFPAAGNTPLGLLSWKSSRYMGDPTVFWYVIETAAGVYNWTALDQIITFQRTNGATVYFGMYGCPTFYAQTAAHPSFGDNVTFGPFGQLGEGSYPTSLAAVTNFVTACITRYNLPGGTWFNANGATLGKGIQYWETWNEPAFPNSNGNVAGPSNPGVGFFWGTAAQMVDLAWTQYAAVKALDSTVIVSSPGFAGPPAATALTFFNTSGSVNPTRTGRSSSEEFAFHPYATTPPYTIFQSYNEDIVSGAAGLRPASDWCFRNNMRLPWRISEWGIDSNTGGATNLAWYSAPAAFRYKWMSQVLMSMMAMGVQAVYPFNWNETSAVTGNSGNWQGDTNGVQKAFNDLATNCLGKRLQTAWYDLILNRVFFNFADGTSYSA